MWGGEGVSGGGGGGVSSSQLAGMLIGYATETWVDEHYISIDFFSRLFQAHGTENGSEIDVMPNDMETVITSVESMFGFWTNLYISALGSNGAAPAGISLGMLTDVNISGTPSAGQVLTFDAATQKWVNGNATGATALANLTDVLLSQVQNGQTLLYDSTTSKWYNSALKTINGQSLLGSGDISVGGGASGNYLPLSGGTMMGTINSMDITPKSNNSYRLGDATLGYHVISAYFINSPFNAPLYIASNWGDKDIFISTGHYVGIGTNTPTHKLEVSGSILSTKSSQFGYVIIGANQLESIDSDACIEFLTGRGYIDWHYNGSSSDYTSRIIELSSGTLNFVCNIYATGAITALSDARKKDITGEAGVTVEQIAHAPAVQFLWKDKERRKDGQQVGTLAQYWQTVLPEVVSDKGGELSMQYGVAALVSAIVTARKVVDHERRITELEKENERLKEEISQLRLN